MMAKHAELEGFSESFPSSDSNLKLGKDDGTVSNSSKCPCTLT